MKAGIIMGENYLEREDYNGKEITEEEMGRGNSERGIIEWGLMKNRILGGGSKSKGE